MVDHQPQLSLRGFSPGNKAFDGAGQGWGRPGYGGGPRRDFLPRPSVSLSRCGSGREPDEQGAVMLKEEWRSRQAGAARQPGGGLARVLLSSLCEHHVHTTNQIAAQEMPLFPPQSQTPHPPLYRVARGLQTQPGRALLAPAPWAGPRVQTEETCDVGALCCRVGLGAVVDQAQCVAERGP